MKTYFNELVVDDILVDDLNIDIPNMEGARHGGRPARATKNAGC